MKKYGGQRGQIPKSMPGFQALGRNKKLRLQSRRKSSGFFLLEIAMVLAILGFVLTIGLKSTGA